MQLQHQELVESLVRQHEEDFALLHADLREASPEVASRWADRFPNAADMSGHNRCTSMRQTLLSMFDGRGEAPFPSLAAREGPGLSVVLSDGSGRKIRVRKWPTDNLKRRIRVVEVPPPGQSEALAQARQLALDEGLDEPVLPHTKGGSFDVFVLWWADDDEVELAGAELAVVADIDSSSVVRILATAPLPAPQPVRAEPAVAAAAPQGDFDEFDESAGTGDTTPGPA